MIEDLGIRRRREVEEIYAEKEELLSVLIVDELNLLSSRDYSLCTNHTPHIFILFFFY